MKISKFQKWRQKSHEPADSEAGWNAACNHILRVIHRRNKEFEGNWQHEDVDYLMEDIKEMVEK